MKTWQIWCEGYSATGESAKANLFGEIEAETFRDACDKFFSRRDDRNYYNPERLTYWGCRLFDSEADARKVFG